MVQVNRSATTIAKTVPDKKTGELQDEKTEKAWEYLF